MANKTLTARELSNASVWVLSAPHIPVLIVRVRVSDDPPDKKNNAFRHTELHGTECRENYSIDHTALIQVTISDRNDGTRTVTVQ